MRQQAEGFSLHLEEKIREIMTELGWEDNRHWAYLALRTVLHTLRDHLTIEEAMHLGAQLPMLIQ
jgi:uncharacterized protein (DUF2267 family)